MHTNTSRRRGTWRRLTARALVGGTIAAIVVASAASAVPPYEPDQHSNEAFNTGGSGNSGGGGGQIDGSSTTPIGDSWDEHVESDLLKITDPGIDFGDGNWVDLIGEPLGSGSVEWDIVDGFYTPRLVGTLHLDGVAGQYGRMHVSYWANGTRIETRHSTSRRAPDDNRHQEWAVDLSPLTDWQLDEVHVCTELSDNNVDFEIVQCKTRYLG
jgi:hypothetical protein